MIETREITIDKVAEFKERHGIHHMLGLIGSADAAVTESDSRLISNGLTLLEQQFGSVAIVCGGTKGGLPEFAYHLAKESHRPVLGVVPEAGQKYSLPDLDLTLTAPAPIYGDIVWGSETPVLASLVDTVFVLGGGWGTLIEVATIIKNQKYRLRHGLLPVKIVLHPNSDGMNQIISLALAHLPAEGISIANNELEFYRALQ